VGLALLAASPTTALAQTQSNIEIEFAPGVAIPIGDFLVSEASQASRRVDSGVGFGMALNLVLDNWEFRYALSILPTVKVEQSWGPTFVEEWNNAFDELGLPDVLIEPNQADGGVKFTGDGSSISIHHVNVGYRFHVYDSDLRVFIPVGIGAAITTGSEDTLSRSLYGLSAQTGVGLSYRALPWLLLGLQVRYLFTLSESTTEVAQYDAIAQSRLTRDALESAFHIGHLIHTTASIAVDF
jgi:hypothetical protein